MHGQSNYGRMCEYRLGPLEHVSLIGKVIGSILIKTWLFRDHQHVVKTHGQDILTHALAVLRDVIVCMY
jgi:hypothetical protein